MFFYLGDKFIFIIRELGALFLFLLEGFWRLFPLQFKKIAQQIYFIGVRSLSIVLLVGLFTGMVLGLQLYYTLVKFGSETILGGAVALSLFREMGPVLTSLMVVARAGSAMTAEIGIMRVTEQIDALVTMNINPVKFLFTPRLIASIVSFPILTSFFDIFGIIGGYLTGVVLLGVNSSIYFSRMLDLVNIDDVMCGFYKALVFGVFVVTMCCYNGFFVHKRKEGFGAKGVSYATTTAVVLSCVGVLVLDYVLTSFLL